MHIFYWKHHINPFGLFGAVKPGEEEGDCVNCVMNVDGVSTGTPCFTHFAKDILLLTVTLLMHCYTLLMFC